jgi:hypothetical protein
VHVQGNEKLYDYVMDRGENNPHVYFLLNIIPNLREAMAALRADGYLAQPFTVPHLLTSVEDAQRLLRSKHKHGRD